MEYFKIYLNAFKNFTDYRSPAIRKEYNFFLLFYFLFYILIFIGLMVSLPFLIVKNQSPESGFIYFTIASWTFFLIHALPTLALVKRRLIDITPKNANLIFWIYFDIEVVRLSIIIPFTVSLYKSTPEFHIWYIAAAILNQFLCTLVMAFHIFLMVKKGNKTAEN